LQRWADYLLTICGRAPGTVELYLRALERACEDCGVDSPEALTRQAIESHVRRLFTAKRGASVRQGLLAAGRSFFEWAIPSGVATSNPFEGMRSPATYRPEIRPLTVQEVRALVWRGREGVLPPELLALRNRAIVAVSYAAGLRASEVGRLQRADLGWDEPSACFSLLIRHAKWARRDRRVWLDEAASRILGTYLARTRGGGPAVFLSDSAGELGRRAVREITVSEMQAAGVEPKGRRLHHRILRHSIASHMLAAGQNIRVVQEHLRHASVATTERYLHPTAGELKRGVRKGSALAAKRREPLQERVEQVVEGILGPLARSSQKPPYG